MHPYCPDTTTFRTVSLLTAFALLLACSVGISRGQAPEKENPTPPPATKGTEPETTQPARAREAQTVDDLLKDTTPPSIHAKKMLDFVLKAAKYEGPPILFLGSRTEPNACAFVKLGEPMQTPEGVKRPIVPVILYNPGFMSRMNITTGNDYVCLGIIAHELGHIVGGHVVPGARGSAMHPWMKELEADRFAGMVMARLGAKPEEVETCYRIMVADRWMTPVKDGKGQVIELGNDKQLRLSQLVAPSQTHPDCVRRIQAIVEGWRDGGGVAEREVEARLGQVFNKLLRQASQWDPGE